LSPAATRWAPSEVQISAHGLAPVRFMAWEIEGISATNRIAAHVIHASQALLLLVANIPKF
jgi:hypothetical protein